MIRQNDFANVCCHSPPVLRIYRCQRDHRLITEHGKKASPWKRTRAEMSRKIPSDPIVKEPVEPVTATLEDIPTTKRQSLFAGMKTP